MTPRPAGDDWQPCPTGLLVNAAGDERTRVSRRRALRIGGAAAVSVLAGGAALALRSRRLGGIAGGEIASDPLPADEPLACDVVQRLLPGMLRSELATQTRVRIEDHLATCGHCRSIWKAMREGRA